MKIRIVVLCLVLLAAAAVIAYASRPEIIPIRQSLADLPLTLSDWTGQDYPEMATNIRNELGVDDYIDRSYYNKVSSASVSLYIGYYESQRDGKTIHSPQNCLPGAGWKPIKNDHVIIPIKRYEPIKVNQLVIQKGVEKQIVVYWYHSHGRVIASEYWGKIYTVIDALRINRTDAALVRVISPIRTTGRESDADDEAFAENSATEFVQTLFPLLNQYMLD